LRSYQSVIILKPDLDEAQVDQALENISGYIKDQGGACLKVDKWGKKRLAYKVKKNRFGYYLNIYHTCDNDKVTVLEEKYRLFGPLIKYMVLRLEESELARVMAKDEKEGEASESANKDEVKKPDAEAKSDEEAKQVDSVPETKTEG